MRNAKCSAGNYSDLKMRMEALGLAAVGDNKEALEQRLLKSVSDLKLLRDEKDKIAERMVALTETVVLYPENRHVGRPADSTRNRSATPAASEAVAETTAKDSGATATPAGRVEQWAGHQREGRHFSGDRQHRQPAGSEDRDALPHPARQSSRGSGQSGGTCGKRSVARSSKNTAQTLKKVKVGDTMHIDVQS